jgi:hypothetical protein
MIDTGAYRNDIPTLSALALGDYERIFKVFERSVDDKSFYVYNTLKKIEFPEIDSQYLGTFNVPSRMPMTLVSYKIYEDIKSWWILYLLNRDKFEGAPFYVAGGTQLKYILPSIVGLVYLDITKGTVFGGRHY